MKIDTNVSKIINPRVRIAPSPTGPLHIGVARTALFNYLFAKKYQGVFILRIEDTDVERSNIYFERDIIENLKWLGIQWDEGPALISQEKTKEIPNSKHQFINNKEKKYIGEYGPYRQSERISIYKKYLKKLLDEGKAYYCFCSEEELESRRQYQISIGQPFVYDGRCRELSEKEVKKYLKENRSFIIRFKTPIKKVAFKDLIRDNVEFDSALIGDFAIAKNLSTPLYNFAAVIDDFEMKISHIIRGEDHISNTPKQILIQEALNFPHPQYAHLPLILGSDKTKLSKRHGATSITELRKAGYLSEALVNFIAFLGWNPGTEREIFSLASLIKEFSLEKIQKGGAIFNIKRLDWINGFYIRQKTSEKLTEMCLPYLIKAGLIEKLENNANNNSKNTPANKSKTLKLFKEKKLKFRIKETAEIIDFNWLEKIVTIYQKRLKKLSEISELTDFFFKKKLNYEKELLRWKDMTDKEIVSSLDKLKNLLSKIKTENWNSETLKKLLIKEAEEWGIVSSETRYHNAQNKEIEKGIEEKIHSDRGKLLWPFRVALTGKKSSAEPFEIAEILGKEKTIKRIEEAKLLFLL